MNIHQFRDVPNFFQAARFVYERVETPPPAQNTNEAILPQPKNGDAAQQSDKPNGEFKDFSNGALARLKRLNSQKKSQDANFAKLNAFIANTRVDKTIAEKSTSEVQVGEPLIVKNEIEKEGKNGLQKTIDNYEGRLTNLYREMAKIDSEDASGTMHLQMEIHGIERRVAAYKKLNDLVQDKDIDDALTKFTGVRPSSFPQEFILALKHIVKERMPTYSSFRDGVPTSELIKSLSQNMHKDDDEVKKDAVGILLKKMVNREV